MKGLIKYLIVYLIGLFFTFTVIWRYNSLDNKNVTNFSKTNNSYIVNNN